MRVEKLLLTSKVLRADGFAFLPLFPHLFLDAPAAQKAGENEDGGENSQAYKQAGNGVTVNVIEAIGRRLFQVHSGIHILQ